MSKTPFDFVLDFNPVLQRHLGSAGTRDAGGFNQRTNSFLTISPARSETGRSIANAAMHGGCRFHVLEMCVSALLIVWKRTPARERRTRWKENGRRPNAAPRSDACASEMVRKRGSGTELG